MRLMPHDVTHIVVEFDRLFHSGPRVFRWSLRHGRLEDGFCFPQSSDLTRTRTLLGKVVLHILKVVMARRLIVVRHAKYERFWSGRIETRSIGLQCGRDFELNVKFGLVVCTWPPSP